MTILTNIFYGALILFGVVFVINGILSGIVRHYKVQEAFAAKAELDTIKEKEHIDKLIHDAFKDIK